MEFMQMLPCLKTGLLHLLSTNPIRSKTDRFEQASPKQLIVKELLRLQYFIFTKYIYF